MTSICFQEAARHYTENLHQENGRNLRDKDRQLRQELVPYFGNIPLDRIKRPEIKAFKRHMLEKGFSPATVNRYLAVLSHLFHKGVEWDWLIKVPCKIIKYREDNARMLYLSPDEVRRLLESARSDPCPIVEPFIRIALGSRGPTCYKGMLSLAALYSDG